MSKLTVKDLFDKKGKVKLTELYVTNALEAYAAEQAGIDIQIVSFKKETLRTGVPTNKWFRDCLLYTSPSPRDRTRSRMPSSA